VTCVAVLVLRTFVLIASIDPLRMRPPENPDEVIRKPERHLLTLVSLESPMPLDSLQSLFENELKDIYNGEKQLVEALPRMAKAASSPELADAITKHLKETEGHVQRIEQILGSLDMPARGKKCKGMEGLLEEGKEILGEDGEEPVKDAALISAAQRVEHYEMAAYGCLKAYAEILGHTDAARLLEKTLKEEEAADKKLNQLAEGGINQAAAAVASAE
jgi:ferritin-like metal-binding protein YciE